MADGRIGDSCARARHVSVVYPSRCRGPARQQEACDPATRQGLAASPSRPSRQRAELLHHARADSSLRTRHQTRPSPSPSVRGSGVILFVGIPPPPRLRQVLLQPAGVAAARAVARRHGTPRDRQAPLGRSWQSSCASSSSFGPACHRKWHTLPCPTRLCAKQSAALNHCVGTQTP